MIVARAVGGRVRLRPEVLEGLSGGRLGEGLGGHWVQAYYLRNLIDAAGGTLDVEVVEGEVALRARLPEYGGRRGKFAQGWRRPPFPVIPAVSP